jgi:hypothetical protein
MEPSLTPQAEVLVDEAKIVGNGLTVIVYVDGVPTQPSMAGVTVIVEVIGNDELLIALKL